MHLFHVQNPDTGTQATVSYDPTTKFTAVQFPDDALESDRDFTVRFTNQFATVGDVRAALRQYGADFDETVR